MLICVLTELSTGYERINKKKLAKELSNPIWKNKVLLIPSIINLISTFPPWYFDLVFVLKG